MCVALSVLSSVQESWVEQWTAAANFVLECEDRAIDLIKRMEGDGIPVTSFLLRSCFEGMIMPEDMQQVLEETEAIPGKLTAQQVKEIAGNVKDNRNWNWIICHPDLGPDRIHGSRSMLAPPALNCQCHYCGWEHGTFLCVWIFEFIYAGICFHPASA